MTDELDFNELWIALQPIVDLFTGRAVGHEALIRGPQGSTWAAPAAIFAAAGRLGRGRELEATCRRLAFGAGSSQLPRGQRLFVNIDARYARLPLDPGAADLDAGRVALEVSEQQEIVGQSHVLAALREWKRQGYTIVLDDYGVGHASLGTLLALQPDVIKIDRYIVGAMGTDRRHRAALESVVSLARDLGVEIVAEGIETREQVALLREVGVGLGQGFLLGAPGPGPVTSSAAVDESPARSAVRRRRARRDRQVPLAGFHRTLFESIDLAVYYVDRGRTILGWNQAAESITGFSSAEVVGRRCMARILDHTSLSGVPLCWGACPLVHTMADGRPRNETVLLRHRHGQRVKVSVHAVPVHDDRGTVVGAVEVFHALEPAPEPSAGADARVLSESYPTD